MPQKQQSSQKNTSTKNFVRVLGMTLLIAITGLNSFLIWSMEQTHSNESNREILSASKHFEDIEPCVEGGQMIYVGIDENFDGVLNDDEIDSSTLLCHGFQGLSGPQGQPGTSGNDGLDGQSYLLDLQNIPEDSDICDGQGITISAGLDVDLDGLLQMSEVVSSSVLCHGSMGQTGLNGTNGTSGYSALVEQSRPPEWMCGHGISISFGVDDGGQTGIAGDGILQSEEIISSLQLCFDTNIPSRLTDIISGAGNSFTSNCEELIHVENSPLVIFATVDSIAGCEPHIFNLTTGATELIFDINPAGDSLPGSNFGFLHVPSTPWVYFDADDGTGIQIWALHTEDLTVLPLLGSIERNALVWNDGLVVWNQSNQVTWTNSTVLLPIEQGISDEHLALGFEQMSNMSRLGEVFAVVSDDVLFMSAVLNDAEQVIVSISHNITVWHIPHDGDLVLLESCRTDDGTAFVALQGEEKQILHLLDDGGFQWLTNLQYDGGDTTLRHLGDNMGLHYLNETLVFDAVTEGIDAMLWSVNLNTLETTQVSSQHLAVGQSAGGVSMNDKIYFDCISPSYGHELCFSDGSASGTGVIDSLRPGIQSSQPRHIETYGEHLFIVAHGVENSSLESSALWVLGEGDLQFVFNPYPGATNDAQTGLYGNLVLSTTHLFFIAHDGTYGHELYSWNILHYNEQWIFI
jgi:ELWxxDGT repeat protein